MLFAGEPPCDAHLPVEQTAAAPWAVGEPCLSAVTQLHLVAALDSGGSAVKWRNSESRTEPGDARRPPRDNSWSEVAALPRSPATELK
jgi:hypothetical protein